nr:hypothetical protein [Tanacetum cinerariifolium]
WLRLWREYGVGGDKSGGAGWEMKTMVVTTGDRGDVAWMRLMMAATIWCGGDEDGTVRVMMAWSGEEMMGRSGGCDGRNRQWSDFFLATTPKVERGEKVYVCVRVRIMKMKP